jgi:hypothetical protein
VNLGPVPVPLEADRRTTPIDGDLRLILTVDAPAQTAIGDELGPLFLVASQTQTALAASSAGSRPPVRVTLTSLLPADVDLTEYKDTHHRSAAARRTVAVGLADRPPEGRSCLVSTTQLVQSACMGPGAGVFSTVRVWDFAMN